MPHAADIKDFEYNLNAWDNAAGILLAQEAGGNGTDFSRGKNPQLVEN